MKKMTKQLNLLLVSLLFTGFAAMAQTSVNASETKTEKAPSIEMKTYVIERNIPGAGQFTAEKLKEISKTSCSVLRELGPGIQWIQSYVTGNKIFCIYKAESIALLKEHAQKGGFPIDNIYEVSSVISPATAN
ncbi:MAG TPA: DUF4242 domain-containing protein [Puia sp.]|nr:DUF4242 domain-containing protein [Puia sp.]